MPTKPLPDSPNLLHLKEQAKDLLRAQRARTLAAGQRIREFHPGFRDASDAQIGAAAFRLADAQLAIAREYGFASWPRLKAHVENPTAAQLGKPAHERIGDRAFKQAVALLDEGDADGLRAFLASHPDVVRRHVRLEGGNYFTSPALLEFVAENPTRHGRLPANIVEVTQAILAAGGGEDEAVRNSALELVASSSVARECGVQIALIDLLCDAGADADCGVYPALLYGEFDAVRALIRRGAHEGLVGAAALGDLDLARERLAGADETTRLRALAMAAQHGRIEVVRLLLDAGVDPNRYAPVGGHSHATPLHQAVAEGQTDVVRLLVERGAKLDVKDIRHDGTPQDWAAYLGRIELAEYLAARAERMSEKGASPCTRSMRRGRS